MFQTFRYRNVEPHCRSLHCQRLRKLPCLSERATQPHAVYLLTPPSIRRQYRLSTHNRMVSIHTPKGRYVALFLTTLEIFRISDSQNQSAETPYTKNVHSHLHLCGVGGTFTCLLSSPVGKQFASQIY